MDGHGMSLMDRWNNGRYARDNRVMLHGMQSAYLNLCVSVRKNG